MTNEEIAALRAAAEAATPGPWHVDATPGLSPMVRDEKRLLVAYMPSGFDAKEMAENRANAFHIAAASPAAVLALLDRLARAEAERDAAQAQVAAAVAAERERIAAEVDCGCAAEAKAAVVAARPNSAARWNACGSSTCGAIEAAAIRASGGTDALAEARAQARREGIEEARALVDRLLMTKTKLPVEQVVDVSCAIRALIEEPSNAAE